MLERWFLLRERGGTLRGEVRGGLTTFMVMAYIMLVRGRGGHVHPMMYGAGAAFVLYFALPLLPR